MTYSRTKIQNCKKVFPQGAGKGSFITFASHTHTQTHTHFAVVAQMVEHQLPKLRVVGSIPIYRSKSPRKGILFLSSSDGSPEQSGSQAHQLIS